MKSASALGILFSTAIFACAPVASSVPKMGPNSSRTGDAIADSKAVTLPIVVSARVVSAGDFRDEVKKLSAEGYEVSEKSFNRNSHEISNLMETRSGSDIQIPAEVNWADVVLILVMKDKAVPVPGSIDDDLHIFGKRVKQNEFSFEVSVEGNSGSAWSYVKANVESMTIAAREAKAKEKE